MNRFRQIEYTDDGCYSYECLACKGRAEVRSFGTTFCGHCGTKWGGELEWDKERKYQRQKLGHGFPLVDYPNTGYSVTAPTWEIQHRYNQLDGHLSHWEDIITLGHARAAAVLHELKRRRADSAEDDTDWGDEYRVVLIPSTKPKLP